MTSNFFSKLHRNIIENAPTILTIMGAIGTVSAVALSTDSAIRAKKIMDESDKDLSKADKAFVYAKAYAPTAIMTAASLTCIFSANHINKQRIAGIAGAYILKETAFREYQDKAEELIGSKKIQKIKDDIIQDHITANPQTDLNTVKPSYCGGPDTLYLWWDEVAKRYFYSNAERIRKAEIQANRDLQDTGFVSVNDIYGLLGLPEIKTGDGCGWEYNRDDPYSSKNRDVVISIEGGLSDIDTPCGVMDMDPRPSSSWFTMC